MRSPPAPAPTSIPPIPHNTADVGTGEPKASDNVLPTPSPRVRPRLLLEVHDLSLPGAVSVLTLHNPYELLADAVSQVMKHLYTPPRRSHQSHRSIQAHSLPVPHSRSVTLIVRDMPGVAHTTSRYIDNDHKEIHLSASYVAGIHESRRKDEIRGVIVHEMVHCFQYDANQTAAGGLIEGIADYVRLKSGCVPPHWNESWKGDRPWDGGYQRTAYFLEWVENKIGPGLVPRMNQWLRTTERYEEKNFWSDCCGTEVEELWKEYREDCETKSESSMNH